MADITWEYIGAYTYEKQVARVASQPASGAYGSVTLYDQEPPTRMVGIKADRIARADAESAAAVMDTPSTTASYTMANGKSITGIPVSVGIDDIPGSAKVNIRLSVMRTD